MEYLHRKPSSGDDVMTMTIEFLRARLLSERSASKAAKLRVQQLATKVRSVSVFLSVAHTIVCMLNEHSGAARFLLEGCLEARIHICHAI